MDNPFPYSFNEKRYHTFNYYLKNRYHCKVSKVMLNAGFSCPNRDGNKGIGGCIFCSEKGSGDSNPSLSESLLKQYEDNSYKGIYEFLLGEVVGVSSRVEVADTQVDRVCTASHGSDEGVKTAGRGQNLNRFCHMN